MKKAFIIIIPILSVASIVFYACKKEQTDLKTQKLSSSGGSVKTASRDFNDIEIPEWATTDLIRIYNDVNNPAYEVAIIDNANYGVFSPNPQNEVYICGATNPEDEITIELNNSSFSPQANGQWFNHGLSWKSYFNTEVDVTIKSGGTTVEQKTIRVPAPHLGSIPVDDAGVLSKTNALLSWNMDNGNTLGYILIHYRLYNSDGECILQDAEVVQDSDESFDFSDVLAANSDANEIFFQVIAGNTVSTQVNGNKILFYIATYDHHRYFLQ